MLVTYLPSTPLTGKIGCSSDSAIVVLHECCLDWIHAAPRSAALLLLETHQAVVQTICFTVFFVTLTGLCVTDI